MKKLFPCAIYVVSLAILSFGCDGNTHALPTRPDAHPTYTLSGTVSVQGPTGLAPVASARLTAGASGLSATTDANGRYTFVNLFGDYALTITKEGFVVTVQSVTVNRDMQLDILVAQVPTYTLWGVVSEITSTGEVPLSDVEVYWSEYKGTMTDAKGEYRIDGMFGGTQPIWIEKDGYTFAIDIPHRLGEPWRDVSVIGDTRFDVQLVRRP